MRNVTNRESEKRRDDETRFGHGHTADIRIPNILFSIITYHFIIFGIERPIII